MPTFLTSILIGLVANLAYGRATIEGRLRHHSSYLLEASELRHHQYEVELTQKADISSRLFTVVQGRARANLALGDRYPVSVIHDENYEIEARQVYMDLLTHDFRLKVGLQKVDWVESLSAFGSDLLTPYDLRFGALGNASELIVPTGTVLFNHKLGEGTLEYMVAPFPEQSRFPKEDNGYGYFPYLLRLTLPYQVTVSEQPIPRELKESEFGARYLAGFSGVDLSVLAVYGHQRSPVYAITPTGGSSAQVLQSYPRVLTLGSALAFSKEAWVARTFFYVEPQREAKSSITTLGPPEKQTRLRLGGGFDYVFSKDLKLYSEIFGTSFYGENFQMFLRATNETWSGVLASLTVHYSFPKTSYQWNPEVAYDLNSYTRIWLGATFIHSSDAEALFESLKNSSRVYASLEYHFDFF